ncbi:MAG: universal stress protein [Deltaproteobacteria bacterium]|uniref:Universal stress protein n=1 Tax=Candidatus Zymogenus saltonus TaxID=2844893 RepID=A0A9D8PSC7_9DELT|nr:universal stress protein [Candidatus Zymogenus saltonus]
MENVKKIIAAVDGSEVSIKAFEWAAGLASMFGAELIVVSVSDKRNIKDEELFPAFLTDKKLNEIVEEFSEKKEGIFKSIQNKCLDMKVKVSAVVLHGLPSDEIINLAGNEEADLIVMGAHGKREEFYHEFSSTSERVLKKAPCPILMIVPQRPFKKDSGKKPHQKPYHPILHST